MLLTVNWKEKSLIWSELPSELFITLLSERYYTEKFGVSQAPFHSIYDDIPFLFFLRDCTDRK